MKFKIHLTTLSPVHIGTGEIIHRNFLLKANGKVGPVDPVRLAEVLGTAGAIRALKSRKLGDATIGLDPSTVWEWSSPLVRGGEGDLYPFVRSRGKPYVPGSSVKGSLRTALLWTLLSGTDVGGAIRVRRPRGDVRSAQRKAAKPLENALSVVGSPDGRKGETESHFSAFRALRPSDSGPIADGLTVYPVRVYSVSSSRELRFTLLAECLDPETVLPSIKCEVDDQLLVSVGELMKARRRTERSEVMQRVRDCLQAFETSVDSFYRGVARREMSYLRRFRADADLEGFYSRILDCGDVLIRTGWGSGWTSITLGPSIRDSNPTEFRKLFRDLRMGKRGSSPETYPVSRKLAKDSRGRSWPLGWLSARLERVEG